MKKKIGLVVAVFLLVLKAQTVFAADDYNDFLSAVKDGNFSKAERILKNNARKWSVEHQSDCWMNISYDENYNNTTAMRAFQLLQQYNVSFGKVNIRFALWGKRPEEIIRYLVDIRMPFGEAAITQAIDKGYADNLVQFLIDKGASVNGEALTKAAEKKRWTIVPILVKRLSEDDMSYRYTRAEYTTYYNSQPSDMRKYIEPYDPILSKSALMFAAEYGQRNIVRLLVDNGAKVNLRADGGETAASLAYDNGEIEVYNYLKEHGAIDYEPKQVTQQPAAPAQSSSTTNVYVQPSTPAPSPSNSPSQTSSTAWNLSVMNGTYNIGGTWNSSVGKGNFMVLNGTGSSGSVNIQINGKSMTGTASISGNNLDLYITSGEFKGQQFRYTIVTNKLIQGDGENFSRY